GCSRDRCGGVLGSICVSAEGLGGNKRMYSTRQIHRPGDGPRGARLTSASFERSPNVIVVVGIAALQPRLAWRLRAEGFSIMRARTEDDAQQFVTERVPVAILLGTS